MDRPPAGDLLVSWVDATSSPRPIAVRPRGEEERVDELLARCGQGEEGLRRVAEHIVARRIAGLEGLDLDGLDFALRAAGEPHVWPRAWVVSGKTLDRRTTADHLEAWARSFGEDGERRCGVATGIGPDGTPIVAAVALDALADLAPLPTRTHVGSWLTIDARLLVPSADAHVVIQGPGSDPRPVPSWSQREGSESHVVARFAPDRPGVFTVQVVADAGSGPRPVLEASVFADAIPPVTFEPSPVPGESAPSVASLGNDADSLAARVTALRDAERLPRFTRDARLDALALAHARRMLAARTVGHDVGDGDPEERLTASGQSARLVGENVAHAASVRLAHRALYESPSHRENLLRGDFDRIGIAVVKGPGGSVWVAEVFTAGLR
jgi:uncharacterized protein YkwD